MKELPPLHTSANPPARASQPLHYRGYMPGLDLLRGAAILMVLAMHGIAGLGYWGQWHGTALLFAYLTSYGASGVHLFYVLSGFLITGILLDSKAKPRYYANFYIRRALRILPAYILLLAVLRLLGIIDWRYLLACLLYIANMAGVLSASVQQYGVLWSLAVEEQFYLLWPVVVARCQPKTLLRLILFALVGSPLLRVFLAARYSDYYYKTWDNADFLLYGALAALGVRQRWLHRGNIGLAATALFAAGSVLMVPAVYVDMHLAQPGHVVSYLLYAGFGKLPAVFLFVGLLLTVIVTTRGTLANAEASRRPVNPAARALAFLGYISYGLYLVHPLVYMEYDRLTAGTALATRDRPFAYALLRCLIGSLVSVALAFASRRTFEQLFLNQKERLAPAPHQMAVPASAGASPTALQPTAPNP